MFVVVRSFVCPFLCLSVPLFVIPVGNLLLPLPLSLSVPLFVISPPAEKALDLRA